MLCYTCLHFNTAKFIWKDLMQWSRLQASRIGRVSDKLRRWEKDMEKSNIY